MPGAGVMPTDPSDVVLSAPEAAALDEAERQLGEVFTPFERDPGGRLVAGSTSYVVYAAAPNVRREGILLRWAAGQGLHVPTVVHLSDDLLVVERLPDEPKLGVGFGQAAVDAALTLGDIVEGPVGLPDRASDESPRPLRYARRARQVTATLRGLGDIGVGRREYLRLRAEVAALPCDTFSHGDFHVRNLLYDTAAGRVAVIDWELFCRAPRGSDLARLYPTVDDPAAQSVVLRALHEQTGDPHRSDLLLRWWAIYHDLAEQRGS